MRLSYTMAMTFQAFQSTVDEMIADIPEEFLKDLQGVHVFEQTKPEADLAGVYRLGEYLNPGTPSFLGGHTGLGRHIALYYGSFVALARFDSHFDWEEQIWETLTHELQHHVESLAGDATLVGEDRRRDALFRKRLGPKSR
jgi:predicted Zn-dependent protease with MMP-like domain